MQPVKPVEKVYIDTSAFYALMDRSDQYHESAKALWPSLLEPHITLLTSNYVVSETMKLLQFGLGFEAASLWHRPCWGWWTCSGWIRTPTARDSNCG
jgi:predicted nucleic acid-binding protein